MRYVEEREFTLRFELRCEFPENYEGELDGYAWAREWEERLAREVVSAAVEVIRRQPGWRVRVGNRGRPVEEEVTLVLEKTLGRAGL